MATHTYIDLEIDEARYLADLVGIEYDLKSTIEWCERYDYLMQDTEQRWLIEPLTTAILVRFIRAVGGGIRYPRTKHILSVLSDIERDDYEHFKNIRDKHAAHSVNEFESNQVKAYYIEENIEKGVNNIQTGCCRIVGLSCEEILKLHNICKLLLKKVESEIKSERAILLKLTAHYTMRRNPQI